MPTFREDPKLGSKVPMIKTADLNEQCVTNSKILDGCITKEKLAKGTVDATTLANKSVGTEKLSDSSVTNEKISNKAVSTEKLADESITKEKIFNASITTEKLANESVSAEKLQSGLRNTIASTYDKTIELDNQKANIADVGNAIERLENKIGERFIVEGDVTNLPDEEDLTSVSTIDGREVMKLNDRAYEPSNFSGKGYKILRKNIKKFDIPTVSIVVSYAPTSSGDITITVNDKVTTINLDSTTDTTPAIVATKIAAALKSSLDDYDVSVSSNRITLMCHKESSVSPSSINVGNTSAVITVKDGVNKNVRKNVLRQDMINDSDTVYEIRYDFDLNNQEISIGEKCILIFNGGSLSNGTLLGNNTFVKYNQTYPLFVEIKLLGTFKSYEFIINLLSTNKVDYFYALLTAFSGTKLILNDDYSVADYSKKISVATPRILELDGKGFTLDLYSLNIKDGILYDIKDITINSTHNIEASWKRDNFNAGFIGTINSKLRFYNVVFTAETDHVYLRTFKNVDISNCIEKGFYFYLYDIDNVDFYNNTITDGKGAYMHIGTQSDIGHINIHNNYFKNLDSFGAIMSGGLKYNISIINNIFYAVGSGAALNSVINVHPKGTVTIKNNYITPNANASTLDIDAARDNMYDDNTRVSIEGNIFSKSCNFTEANNIALVGLGNLYLRNNSIEDHVLSLWNTTNAEIISNNIIFNKYVKVFADISRTFANKKYKYLIINNFFKNSIDISSYFLLRISNTGENTVVDIYGIRNTVINNKGIEIGGNNVRTNIYGDLYFYDKGSENTLHVNSNDYINIFKKLPTEKYALGLRYYNTDNNKEIRGNKLGITDTFGNPPYTLLRGTTSQRPSLCYPGTPYFDTDLGKTIYAKGTFAKMDVTILSDLITTDKNDLLSDVVTVYMGNFSFVKDTKSTNEKPNSKSRIFEDFLKDIKDKVKTSSNWDTYTHTITCPYVGQINSDYGVIHSNTTNGYLTEYKLVNDGTISWVEEDGEWAGITRCGTFLEKPTLCNKGFQYFNIDTHKMITWDGSKWWNPDGTEANS